MSIGRFKECDSTELNNGGIYLTLVNLFTNRKNNNKYISI